MYIKFTPFLIRTIL